MKKVFQTQFKNGTYISDFSKGFSARSFIGTQQEYDQAIQCFLDNEELGKIIGIRSFTMEEWDKLHPPEKLLTSRCRTYLSIVKENRSEQEYQDELFRYRRSTRIFHQNKKRRR